VSGGFKDRLAAMCNDTVVLVRDPLLSIALSCVVEGDLPPAHVPAVLCLAHHLVRNAVQHGMEMHLIGAIEVRVEAGVDVTMLEVRDDGWGVTSRPLETVRRLAERDGGVLHEDVSWDCTVTTVRLPAPSTLWRPGLPGW
jgi:two-component sensor histidine kinase